MAGVFAENERIIKEVEAKKEVAWRNPYFLPFDMTNAVCELVVADADIADAEKRLARFAPFIVKQFPETVETNGLIESPLIDIAKMQKELEKAYDYFLLGTL